MPYEAENKVCVIAMDLRGGAPFAAYVLFDSVRDAYLWMQEPAQASEYRMLEALPVNTLRQRAYAQERLDFWTALES